MYELTVESQFDSAHNLRNYEGPCESLHGHTYKIQASYKGPRLTEVGLLIDFKQIKTALNDVVSYLDHCYLNELPEFQEKNPTAENIAETIFSKLRAKLGPGISKVTVWETPTSSASYYE